MAFVNNVSYIIWQLEVHKWFMGHHCDITLTLRQLPQVKAEVERKVAQLFAWSIDCASKGVAPSVGFEGETFEKGSTRWKMQGKELAKGWRNLFQVT